MYTIHEHVGHLGIFVSGDVARKEHGEFANNIDLIDVLPPGLYEATFAPRAAEAASPDLVNGDWVMRCEPRTLDDIRALGGNDAEDERRFAAAARVSEINLSLYRTFLQPWVCAMVTAAGGEAMRRLHPLRLQYEVFADRNPCAATVAKGADWARSNRTPVSAGNSFLACEQGASRQIVAALDAWRDLRDRSAELMFLSVYGSPLLQAAVGIDPAGTAASRRPGKDPFHRELLRERIAELKSRISVGGLREAAARVAIYVGMACGGPDERVFAAVRRLRPHATGGWAHAGAIQDHDPRAVLHAADRPGASLAAIPKMLPANAEERSDGLAAIFQILTASGDIVGEAAERLSRLARLFGLEEKANPLPFRRPEDGPRAKAS